MNLADPSSILPNLPNESEVLIIRLRRLGDTVLLTPALAALHAWRPDLRISVLVEPAFAPILDGNPSVSHVFLAGSWTSTALELRRHDFAVAYNQHGGPSSALLTAAVGASARVCWADRQFSFIYNVLVPDPQDPPGGPYTHTAEHLASQFYFTGLPRAPLPPAKVYPQPTALAAIDELLSGKGIDPARPLAVLHPGARSDPKRWATENFVALAEWLRTERDLVPVIILGAEDARIAASVRGQIGRRAAILDSLDIRRLIALLSRAQLFVGNDAGPMHLAAAAGCPVVAIFGASSSAHWRPWSPNHRVVQNDFPCNPCRADRCYEFDEPRCILSITVDQVQRACDSLLTSGRSVGVTSALKIAE